MESTAIQREESLLPHIQKRSDESAHGEVSSDWTQSPHIDQTTATATEQGGEGQGRKGRGGRKRVSEEEWRG
jgi:hypothetical protein